MDDFRIIRQLKGYRASYLFRSVLAVVVVSGFVFAVPALLGGVWDRSSPWRESTCFQFVSGIGALALVFLAVRLIMALRRPFDVGALVRKVEGDRPELMNALSCARELVDGRGPSHPLHHALLAELDASLTSEDLHKSVTEGQPKLVWLFGLLLVSAGMMIAAHFMPLGFKARAFAFDLMNGESTGMSVTPGSVDVPEMADVRVQATVLRGPTSGVWIILKENGREQRFQMTRIDGNHFEFDVFGVRETMEYQVVTPTLSSKRHRLTVFKRPELDDVEIQVTPPKYTGLDASKYSGLQPLSVPQNAEVAIAGRPNVPLTATLLVGHREVPFVADGDAVTASVTARVDEEYRLRLEDADGHVVELGPWPLATIDDMPPLIKVLVPDQESKSVPPGKSTPIVVECSDDYGIGTLKLYTNKNGRGWAVVDLLAKPSPGVAETTIANAISLAGGEVGDVFVYYLEATDFAEPEKNRSRSGVRFIEIRPEKKDSPDDKQGGGGDRPPDDQLTVADLIMRTKAMIRETFALDVAEPSEREQALAALTGKSADLFLDAKRRYQALKDKADANNLSLGDIGDLFASAVDDLESAYKMMGQSLPVEASGHHQSALSALIRIEVELEKQMKKKKGSGKGKESENQAKSEKGDEKEQEKARENQRKRLDQVKKALETIDELIAREAGIRRNLKQLSGSNPEARKKQMAHVARKQKDVAEQTGRLADEVAKTLSEAPGLSMDLKRALMRMRQAGRQMDANQPEDASSNAQRAETFLKRAKATAEALRRNLSGSQMDRAMAALDGLIKRQDSLSNSTGQLAKSANPSREESKQLSDAQEAVKREFQDVLNQLGNAAEELEEQTPGAGKALERLIEQSENKRISGNMQRATNALKYRKPGRAVGFQKSAQAGMASMSDALKALRKQLGKATPEQLAAMLETMMKNLQQLDQAKQGKLSDEQRAALAKKVGGDAKAISDLVGKQELRQLSDKMSRFGQSADGTIPPEVAGLAAQFCQILEKELFHALMKRKVKRTSIGSGDVPENYRKLVEEYFKALAEDRELDEK